MSTTTVISNGTSGTQINSTSILLEDQFVDMGFLTRYTGLTDKWFYKLIQEKKFPPPVKFGRSSRWLKSEIESWVRTRINTSRPS